MLLAWTVKSLPPAAATATALNLVQGLNPQGSLGIGVTASIDVPTPQPIQGNYSFRYIGRGYGLLHTGDEAPVAPPGTPPPTTSSSSSSSAPIGAIVGGVVGGIGECRMSMGGWTTVLPCIPDTCWEYLLQTRAGRLTQQSCRLCRSCPGHTCIPCPAPWQGLAAATDTRRCKAAG